MSLGHLFHPCSFSVFSFSFIPHSLELNSDTNTWPLEYRVKMEKSTMLRILVLGSLLSCINKRSSHGKCSGAPWSEWLSTRKGNSLSLAICWGYLWGHRWMQQWRQHSAFVHDTSLLGACGMCLKAQVGFQLMQTFQPTHFVWTVIWSGSAWHHHLVFYTRRYLIVIFLKSKIRDLLFSAGFHLLAEAGGSLQNWALHPWIERLQMWYLKRTKQHGRV